MCIFTTPASIIYFLINDMLSLFVRLVRRLRRFRSAGFLEALIVPKRIEHRNRAGTTQESAGKVSEKFSLFFGRKGGDDFFEARIAAERIPDREQF
jgi:hypothetical protein